MGLLFSSLSVCLCGCYFRAKVTCFSVACSPSVLSSEGGGVGFIRVSTSSWSLSMLASDSQDSDALENDCLTPVGSGRVCMRPADRENCSLFLFLLLLLRLALLRNMLKCLFFFPFLLVGGVVLSSSSGSSWE